MQNKKTKLIVVLLAGLLLCGVTSCQKTEEAKTGEHAATPPSGHEAAKHEMPGAGHGAAPETPAKPKNIVISDEIKAAWGTVTIAVKDKESGATKNYDVKPESEFAIPDSNLTVKVGAYMPDFSMTPDEIVSRSAEPNNPAIQVDILEGGVEKYKGWLFAKFPDMHSFEHPKVSITLVDKSAEGEATPTPAH